MNRMKFVTVTLLLNLLGITNHAEAEDTTRELAVSRLVEELLECSTYYEFSSKCLLDTLRPEEKSVTKSVWQLFQRSTTATLAAFELADDIEVGTTRNRTIKLKRIKLYEKVKQESKNDCSNLTLITEKYARRCEELLGTTRAE